MLWSVSLSWLLTELPASARGEEQEFGDMGRDGKEGYARSCPKREIGCPSLVTDIHMTYGAISCVLHSEQPSHDSGERALILHPDLLSP